MQSTQSLKWSEKSSRVAAGVVIGLVLLLGGALATLLFGMVHGEEFSPGSFQRRSFFYYQIPMVGGQISPVFRQSQDDSLAKHLRKRALIVKEQEADRWDVVFLTAISQPRRLGSAYNLCAYLDMTDEKGKPRWLVWSQEHPELAKVLWPALARMAAEKIYFAVPEMMDQARLADSPEQLQSRLETIAEKARQIAHSTDHPANS